MGKGAPPQHLTDGRETPWARLSSPPSGLGQVLLHVARCMSRVPRISSRLQDALAARTADSRRSSRGGAGAAMVSCIGLLRWIFAAQHYGYITTIAWGIIMPPIMADGDPYGLDFLLSTNEALLDRRQHSL